MSPRQEHIVALAGGVGGAKLAHGLAMARPEGRLSVVVNTADDFTIYGLHISPDLDTVMYTLAGLANPETGWGLIDESFSGLDMLARYGRDAWFRLGDRDFATHILRTERLRDGAGLSQVTAELAQALGVTATVIPMCDEPVATLVETPDGALDFQDYFVRRGQSDEVQGVRFVGIEQATLSPALRETLASAAAVVLCPSNPIVSIGPILAVPGVRDRLCSLNAPVVAVSPIIGGKALKGPADRMLAAFGHEVSPFGVASLYRDFLTGIVIDEEDGALARRIEALGIATLATNTIMRTDDDRRVLAAETLDFADRLAATGTRQ